MQGRKDADQWVKKFTVDVSDDRVTWSPVDSGNEFVNPSRATHHIFFNSAIRGVYVRIKPRQWHAYISLRCGVIVRNQRVLAHG